MANETALRVYTSYTQCILDPSLSLEKKKKKGNQPGNIIYLVIFFFFFVNLVLIGGLMLDQM